MITRRTARFALLPVLLAALVACGDEGRTDGGLVAGGTDLDGTTYVVTGVTVDGEPRNLVKGSEIRIGFKGGNLGISAGCNSIGGAYDLDGSRLVVEPLAMTEMGCSEPLMQQDAWVAGLFEDPVQLITGDDASIISGGTVLSLTDRNVVSPDRALKPAIWELDSIGTGDSVSSVPEGISSTLEIEADGNYSITWTCGGSRGGTLLAHGDRLRFGPESSLGTVDCVATGDNELPPSGEVGDAIDAVFENGTVTWSIEEDRLTLVNGDASLGFVAR